MEQENKNIEESLYKFPEVTSLLLKKDNIVQHPIRTPSGANGYMCAMLENRTVEECAIVTLDGDKVPICYAILGRGTHDKTPFDITEILRVAILSNAKYVILYHNHVVKRLSPSLADDRASYYIYDCLADFGITLLDSIIVGRGGKNFYSYFRDNRGPFVDNNKADIRHEKNTTEIEKKNKKKKRKKKK